MWSGNKFQFRLFGVDKIYVAGFTDKYSRYRMKSKISLYKNAASAVYAHRDTHCFGRISHGIYVGIEEKFVWEFLKGEVLKSGNKLLFY